MLDKYSSIEIIKKKHLGWIDKCLSNPNLSHGEKFLIAAYGNDEHRTILLDNHKLDHITKKKIFLNLEIMNIELN